MTTYYSIVFLCERSYRMEFECDFVLARVALIDVAERDLERVAVSGLQDNRKLQNIKKRHF